MATESKEEIKDLKREETINKMVEFAIAFKDDPDFNRIPFPNEVIKRLEELGIKQEKKQYNISQAVDKCFNMQRENHHQYTSNKIELIDQTGLSISFPPVPSLVPPTNTSDSKTLEIEDCSNPPASGDE